MDNDYQAVPTVSDLDQVPGNYMKNVNFNTGVQPTPTQGSYALNQYTMFQMMKKNVKNCGEKCKFCLFLWGTLLFADDTF